MLINCIKNNAFLLKNAFAIFSLMDGVNSNLEITLLIQ